MTPKSQPELRPKLGKTNSWEYLSVPNLWDSRQGADVHPKFSQAPKKHINIKKWGPKIGPETPPPRPPPLEILYALYSAGKTNTYTKNLGA